MSVAKIVGLACVVVAMSANAAERRARDWIWNTESPDLQWASTANDAGEALGQFCDATEGKCFYAVSFDTTCEEGASYPAIVNTDAGASAITLRCGVRLENGTNLMVASDFDQMDGLVRGATRMGFALPMESDAFRAVRFSLKGADKALDRMREVAVRTGSRRPDAKQSKSSEVF